MWKRLVAEEIVLFLLSGFLRGVLCGQRRFVC